MIGLTGPDTATRYRDFARYEARGNSALYEQWAYAVAADDAMLALLDQLPTARRQPNLLFAAARFLGLADVDAPEFTGWVTERWGEVTAVMAARSTQTNEAGRCATLLPVLSRIPGRLALIEVGASAGVCLYPDRYSYRYETAAGEVALDPPGGPSTVTVSCRADGPVEVAVPDVVRRAGLDLNPLDAADPETRAWLRALVWPGQDERLARLDAALDIVAAEPPPLVRGDLTSDLTALIDDIRSDTPDDVTVVVFHSAVLAYVDPDGRREFRRQVEESPAVWISNESPGVFPDITGRLPAGTDVQGRFVLGVDGVPVALTGPHGQSYTPVPASP